jgi:hypothetical protein
LNQNVIKKSSDENCIVRMVKEIKNRLQQVFQTYFTEQHHDSLADYLHYKMVTEQTESIYAQVLHFLYTCTVKVQLHNAIFYLIS